MTDPPSNSNYPLGNPLNFPQRPIEGNVYPPMTTSHTSGLTSYQPGSTPYQPAITPYQPGSTPYPHPNSAVIPEANSSEISQPTAPPLEHIEKIPGYEGITFATTTLPPPVYPQLQQPPPERGNINSFSGISEDDVHEAVLNYVAENCCYGKKAAQEMVIRNITMSSAFHYTLETFGEKRETAWAYDSYNGEMLDTPMMGTAPAPWDISLLPPQNFDNKTQHTEVPHTASAMSCHTCVGVGRERCSKCQGFCQIRCTWCNGNGKRFNDRCNHCGGDGRKRCDSCQGTGQMKCRSCCGTGSLKCYVKLTTTWTNHKDDFIVEETRLPDELIRDVTGHIAFEEQHPRVWPINHFPDVRINQASNDLVAKHSQEFTLERMLQQRQKVRIVPVAEVNYSWKDRNGEFFVYGFEHKVHFPDYPQTCCWGCTIL